MITHSKNNKSWTYIDGSIKYPLPKAFLATMNKEFDALLKNGMWSTPCRPQCHWFQNEFFRINHKVNIEIEWYKASLVAKGILQQSNIDYSGTYNLLVKPTMVLLILSIIVSFGWLIRQIDIHNAFLRGSIYEEVYMTQPLRFAHPQFPYHLCKLHKALYGLKQTPRAWFS